MNSTWACKLVNVCVWTMGVCEWSIWHSHKGTIVPAKYSHFNVFGKIETHSYGERGSPASYAMILRSFCCDQSTTISRVDGIRTGVQRIESEELVCIFGCFTVKQWQTYFPGEECVPFEWRGIRHGKRVSNPKNEDNGEWDICVNSKSINKCSKTSNRKWVHTTRATVMCEHQRYHLNTKQYTQNWCRITISKLCGETTHACSLPCRV